MKRYTTYSLLAFFTVIQGCDFAIEEHIPVVDKIKKELVHHGHK